MEKIIKFWPQSDERTVVFMTDEGNYFYGFRDETNDVIALEVVEPYVKNEKCLVYVIFDDHEQKYHILSSGEQVKSLDIVCSYVPACFLLKDVLVIAELAEYVLAVPRLVVKEGYAFSQAKVINLANGACIRHSLPDKYFYSDVFVNALGNLVLRKGEEVIQFAFNGEELKQKPFDVENLKSWLSWGAVEPEKVGISPDDVLQLFMKS